METRSAKRKKLLNEENEGVDRISDLPDAVLHQILFLLPIKSIAQTSVLSKRWQCLWSSFPDLDFTSFNPTGNPSTYPDSINHKRILYSTDTNGIESINQALALRDKHCDIRALRFRAHLSFSSLHGLIRRAIRHNVQELDVEVATDDYFNLPRCIIQSESLRALRLKSLYPGFRLLPSTIMTSGFRSLHTLSLSLVILYNRPFLLDLFTDTSFPHLKKLSLDACFGLERLHVSCQALEDLTLENCFQLHGLDISGAKLDRLRVASCFDAFSEETWVKINAPKLRTMLWEYNSITDNCFIENLISLHEASIGFFILNGEMSATKLWSASSILAGLSHAHCLTLKSQCIEILSTNNYFAVPLNPFYKLKSLELHTGFNKSDAPGLACLFRSSPTLHTLILRIIGDDKIDRRQWYRDLWEVYSSEEERYWESQSRALSSFLHHLKVVKIHGFVECENEISLAKFLLKHGRALQEMILCSGHCHFRDSLRRQKIRSQMMGFSWASSNAKIAFH